MIGRKTIEVIRQNGANIQTQSSQCFRIVKELRSTLARLTLSVGFGRMLAIRDAANAHREWAEKWLAQWRMPISFLFGI